MKRTLYVILLIALAGTACKATKKTTQSERQSQMYQHDSITEAIERMDVIRNYGDTLKWDGVVSLSTEEPIVIEAESKGVKTRMEIETKSDAEGRVHSGRVHVESVAKPVQEVSSRQQSAVSSWQTRDSSAKEQVKEKTKTKPGKALGLTLITTALILMVGLLVRKLILRIL